jgi:alkylation response protein AidB-like acyl-CoA dehydrogenase
VGEGELGKLQTTLTPNGGNWLLEGDKYYSTGSLYADWIPVTAQRTDDPGPQGRVVAIVPAQTAGVERIDDWDGFGQRLTASGTTRFRSVRVNAADVAAWATLTGCASAERRCRKACSSTWC